MKKLIVLTLLVSSVVLQPTYCGAQNDTICLPTVVYKEILKLAETGVSLEVENEKLAKQLERDAARTIEMSEDIDKLQKKVNRRKFLIAGLGALAAVELTWLILLGNLVL